MRRHPVDVAAVYLNDGEAPYGAGDAFFQFGWQLKNSITLGDTVFLSGIFRDGRGMTWRTA